MGFYNGSRIIKHTFDRAFCTTPKIFAVVGILGFEQLLDSGVCMGPAPETLEIRFRRENSSIFWGVSWVFEMFAVV